MDIMIDELNDDLFWDADYAIAMALAEQYPTIEIERIGLEQLKEMILSLPAFCDDPQLVTTQILLDIQTVWYEEVTPL